MSDAIPCPKCGALRLVHDRGSEKCMSCHRAYMRNWRKSHPMTAEQRMKDNARSYAGVYKRRGILKEQPCAMCRSDDAEMHHADYSKPLEVKWLCRDCHEIVHHNERSSTNVSRGR